VRLSLKLNGSPFETEARASLLLIDLLRTQGLTGTKLGCAVGVCGACTVLVDDEPVSSCLYLAACAGGRDVWTIEGVADRFPEIVNAFVEHEGFQCGACTPGQVVAVAALKLRAESLDEAGVREYLAGNLCRCTGYGTIIEAARAALGA
jgi:carbon-monoxide dehydrogenase small subunit